MLAGSALLIVTGYGLYYLGGETTRELTSVLHWGVGLILPGVLVWHVRQGRKPSVRRLPRRRRRTTRSAEPPEELAAGPRIIH